MLSTIAFVVAFAAGASAQANQTCDAPNGVPYDFCGSVGNGEYNLYWNYLEDTEQLSLLYSALTPGWHAFGFPQEGAGPNRYMPLASVVPGCIDFVGQHEIDADNATSADWIITARNASGIFPGGRQGLTQYQAGETDGYCWVRFVRPFMAADIPESTAQDITGEAQPVVWAWGPETFEFHGGNRIGVTMINFADGTGVEAVAARPPIVDGGDGGNDGGNDDGAASALSMAAVVPALVAVVAALL